MGLGWVWSGVWVGLEWVWKTMGQTCVWNPISNSLNSKSVSQTAPWWSPRLEGPRILVNFQEMEEKWEREGLKNASNWLNLCKFDRCDRILWYGKGVKQLSYFRSESKFSDHRPVSAQFLAQIELLKSTNPRVIALSKFLPTIPPPKQMVSSMPYYTRENW